MADGATKSDSRLRWLNRNFDLIKLAVLTGGSGGGAGLIGHGPPGALVSGYIYGATATSTTGVNAADAAAGTTWLDDDADVIYVKKVDGTFARLVG